MISQENYTGHKYYKRLFFRKFHASESLLEVIPEKLLFFFNMISHKVRKKEKKIGI